MPALSRHAVRVAAPAANGLLDVQRPASVIQEIVRRMASPFMRVIDQGALSLALLLTILSFYLAHSGDSIHGFLIQRVSLRTLLYELGFLLGWRTIFWMMGLYQPRLIRNLTGFLWRIPLTVVACAGLLIPVLAWRLNDGELARLCFVFWFTGTTLMMSTRAAMYTYDELVRPHLRRRRSVVICGTGLRARALALELAAHPTYRYQLLGFIDSHPQSACDRLAPLLGSVGDMEDILMRLPADEVIIALPVKSQFSAIEQIVSICGRAGVQLQYSLDLFSTDIAKNRTIESIDSNRVVLQMVSQDHRLYLKNGVDRVVAGIGLFLLSPILLLVAMLIKLTSDGPIFFVQQRFGLNKRKFGMIKFRSMVTDAESKQAAIEHLNEIDGPMFKVKNDPRVTVVGRFIRRTSIDELPQLINVLRGEMSLVGPRPLPSRDVERFSAAWLMRRFSVKPGITGLWQVSGRSNTDFDNTIKLDLRYIDHWSLALDAKILIRTFSAVVRGSGAY